MWNAKVRLQQHESEANHGFGKWIMIAIKEYGIGL